MRYKRKSAEWRCTQEPIKNGPFLKCEISWPEFCLSTTSVYSILWMERAQAIYFRIPNLITKNSEHWEISRKQSIKIMIYFYFYVASEHCHKIKDQNCYWFSLFQVSLSSLWKSFVHWMFRRENERIALVSVALVVSIVVIIHCFIYVQPRKTKITIPRKIVHAINVSLMG